MIQLSSSLRKNCCSNWRVGRKNGKKHGLFQYVACFSSDIRKKNAENLRGMRSGENVKTSKDGIDYRYRTGSASPLKEQLNRPISDYWGEDVISGEKKRQALKKEQNTKETVPNVAKFVSFFDEVDARMETSRKYKLSDRFESQSSASNSSSTAKKNPLFDLLNKNSGEDKTKSIFDAFPLNAKEPNPLAYDKKMFRHYQQAMTEVLESDKFRRAHTRKPIKDDVLNPVIEWLVKDEQSLEYKYEAMDDAISKGINIDDTTFTGNLDNDDIGRKKKKKRRKKALRDEVFCDGSEFHKFHSQLMKQRIEFMESTGLSAEQMDIAERAINILASNCARSSNSLPLSIVWEKIKESGFILSNDTLNVLLYVSGTLTHGLFSAPIKSGFSSNGRKKHMSAVMSILGTDEKESIDKEEENEKEIIDFPTEVAYFHDLLYNPTEKSVSLRVKRLVSKGDAVGAEKLLDAFPSTDEARLRTYLPVLRLYCDQGNIPRALKLFRRMRDSQLVFLEPENYVLLLSTLAENGCFKSNATPIDDIEGLGYKNNRGPELFDELAGEMAEDVLEISAASARRLYNALATGLEGENFTNEVKPINTLAGVSTNNEEAAESELILSRVSVDKKTALCPRSGVKLSLIKLERDQQQQLHKGLMELSENQYEEFARNHGRTITPQDKSYAANMLCEFSSWLEYVLCLNLFLLHIYFHFSNILTNSFYSTREGDPFTAIVDGANVAYFMQNFAQGKFNYYQLQFVVDALEKSNENPLVILPYKYCNNAFGIKMGNNFIRQVLSREEKDIINNLNKKGQLYRVPSNCLDDYYWMVASVSDQTMSRQGRDLDVPAGNKEGRWPGARPMLITNDQMRDHKLELLEPRLFRRWTSCFIVNYSFTAFVDKDSLNREISFSAADFFSREIQSNPSSNGTVWHFPVSDWELDDRFCVKIPK